MRRLVAPISFGLIIGITLIVPIAVFAFFTRTTIDSDITARAQQDREVAARLAADVVHQRLERDVADLARFAARPDVFERARAHDGAALDGLLAGFVSPYSFKLAGIVDPHGAVVAHQPEGGVDPSFAIDVVARAAAAGPQGWAFLAPDGRAPTRSRGTTAVLVAPLEVESERWAIYGLLDCAPIASVFAPLPIPAYRAVVLLDAAGAVIASADPSGITRVPPCSDIIEFPGSHVYTLDISGLPGALAGEGSGTVTMGGAEYLAAHVAVIPGHWVLYLLDSPEIALAGERRLTSQVNLGAGIAAAAATIVAITLAWLVDRLRRQRTELAQLAVTQERLRFARDLHDLLGRSLSLIAIKAELAQRLLPAHVAGATREIDDLEGVARQALRDMRDAVVGYREPSLAVELDGARSVLEAAGIVCSIERDDGVLPEQIDALFAWTVREGVTNIVRHSGATRCTIRISRQPHEARVEITDDGTGGFGGQGHGLQGLRERAAARGGITEAGRLPDRGFRVTTAVPLGSA